jgi:hypothetical protein
MPFVKKENLEKLVGAGQIMSNICFNMAQDVRIPEADRLLMKNSQKAWDKAETEFKKEATHE